LAVAQTGHESTPGSHERQRHRCQHGSSSTHASLPPHALHDADNAVVLDASASKQHDCMSSASPSHAPPIAPAVVQEGDCIRS
jgi:hypothetical protein